MDNTSQQFCQQCGTPISAGSQFCPKCGTALQPNVGLQRQAVQPAVIQVEHIHKAPEPNKRSQWHPCAIVGIIALGVTIAIVVISFVGCVGCAALFTSGANQVSKEMQLAEDKSSHPEKYTKIESGVDVTEVKVVEQRYGEAISVSVKNTTEKKILSVIVRVKTADEYGNSGSFSDVSNCKVVEPEKPLLPGKSASGTFSHFGNKYVIESNVVTVLYDDQTVWPDDYYFSESETQAQ